MIIESLPSTGPYGDKRSLRITIGDGRIEVVNTLASEGNQLEVARPVYGYELHLAREIERLQVELEWWKQQPHENCDSKCEYGKRGDPKGCDCGRAAWHAKRPARLTIVNG